jgi:DNA invertase Pin-like site-specific DNA recombinase
MGMSPKKHQKTKQPRMLAYLRQSQSSGLAEDDPRARSLPQQREAIAGYAKLYGLNVIDEVAERDVSGGKAAAVRGIGPLIERVKNGEADGVIAYDISRLGRDLRDFLNVVEEMDEVGGSLVAVKERVDTTTKDAMARFFFQLTASIAEMERTRMTERFAVNVRDAAERGVFPSRTPVGYRKTVIGFTSKGDPIQGPLEPDPDVGPVITDLFRRRAMGASLQECSDLLAEATGKGWSRSSISQMFTSPTYLGKIVIGNEIHREGTHSALTDERTWQLAQRKGKRPDHNGSLASQGILAGLIRCAKCGGILTLTAAGPPGARIASYSCRKYKASGTCEQPASGNVAKIDALVKPELTKREKKLRKGASFTAMVKKGEVYAAAQAELETFLAGASITALGADLYNAEVARRRDVLQKALEEVQEATRAMNLLQYGTDPMGAGDASPLAQDRELARKAIESVTLRKSKTGKGGGRWDPLEDRLTVVWR